MPGALTAAQVEALDLDHWLLFFRKNLVHMEVSIPFILRRFQRNLFVANVK